MPDDTDFSMRDTELPDLIRAAGGIVHSDGNIFFTNAEKFMEAARTVAAHVGARGEAEQPKPDVHVIAPAGQGPDGDALAAAWQAFQSFPIDHAEDSDEQQRLAVEASARAALASSASRGTEGLEDALEMVAVGMGYKVPVPPAKPGDEWLFRNMADVKAAGVMLPAGSETHYVVTVADALATFAALAATPASAAPASLGEVPQGLVQQVRDVLEVQGCNGNWNSDGYMRGLFNGMELVLSILESREPQFRPIPESVKPEGQQTQGHLSGADFTNRTKDTP